MFVYTKKNPKVAVVIPWMEASGEQIFLGGDDVIDVLEQPYVTEGIHHCFDTSLVNAVYAIRGIVFSAAVFEGCSDGVTNQNFRTLGVVSQDAEK